MSVQWPTTDFIPQNLVPNFLSDFTSSKMDSLSDEIHLLIFSFLDYKDLSQNMRACKNWQRLASDDFLWKRLSEESNFSCSQKNLRNQTWNQFYIENHQFIKKISGGIKTERVLIDIPSLYPPLPPSLDSSFSDVLVHDDNLTSEDDLTSEDEIDREEEYEIEQSWLNINAICFSENDIFIGHEKNSISQWRYNGNGPATYLNMRPNSSENLDLIHKFGDFLFNTSSSRDTRSLFITNSNDLNLINNFFSSSIFNSLKYPHENEIESFQCEDKWIYSSSWDGFFIKWNYLTGEQQFKISIKNNNEDATISAMVLTEQSIICSINRQWSQPSEGEDIVKKSCSIHCFDKKTGNFQKNIECEYLPDVCSMVLNENHLILGGGIGVGKIALIDLSNNNTRLLNRPNFDPRRGITVKIWKSSLLFYQRESVNNNFYLVNANDLYFINSFCLDNSIEYVLDISGSPFIESTGITQDALLITTQDRVIEWKFSLPHNEDVSERFIKRAKSN